MPGFIPVDVNTANSNGTDACSTHVVPGPHRNHIDCTAHAHVKTLRVSCKPLNRQAYNALTVFNSLCHSSQSMQVPA